MSIILPHILGAALLTQPVPHADPATEFNDASALLDALEDADRNIDTFHARIVYDRIFMLQDDRHVRYGDLYFQVHPPDTDRPDARPTRTFAIHFHTLVLDGAAREEEQAWIFDGRWLVEKRFADKQYVAREIARPGTRIDPLRLGEGPLPIPIGQRKADILARYDAALVPWDDAFDPEDPSHRNYMEGLRDTTQIHLTPLPHRRAEDDFRSIRLWYRHDDAGRLLPVLARTLDRKGDETFVQLADITINRPIPDNVIDIEPPPSDAGWDVQIEEWRADEPPPALPTPQAEAAPADED